MSKSQGSTDEAIGRPTPWGEGRYQQPGKSVDESVIKPPATDEGSSDIISTPVTRKDYEKP
jgi:hypothetical protein